MNEFNEYNEIYNWMISTTKRVKKILSQCKKDPEYAEYKLDRNLINTYDKKLERNLIDHYFNKRIIVNSKEHFEESIILTHRMFKEIIDEFFQHCRLDDPSEELVSHRIELLSNLEKELTSVADFSLLNPI